LESSRAPTTRMLARLRLAAAAALFSTGGAAIKACTLSSWQIAAFRSVIAAATLLALLPAARRRWSRSTIAVGAAYAATLILFVTANKLTTAANTIFLQYTAPLYILILGPVLLDEHIGRRDLVYMGILAAGLALFFVGIDSPSASAPHPFAGNVVAAAAGISWALTVIGLRAMGRRNEDGAGLAAVVAGNVMAFVVCLPLAVPVQASGLTDWLTLAYLGVFQIGVAYMLLVPAMQHVRALDASLLLLLEPVLNPVWAWLAQGETPSPWSLGGGALILTATACKAWLDVRRQRAALSPAQP
jgi:DME family drug/metabolite transporter